MELTAKEYDLIELLMRNPRRIYSRENLMNVVWGYSYAGDYRTVDVHIRRLREKLEQQPGRAGIHSDQVGSGLLFQGIRPREGAAGAACRSRFGLSYILIIAAVLVLLNTYPVLVSQDLVFHSKVDQHCRAASPSSPTSLSPAWTA